MSTRFLFFTLMVATSISAQGLTPGYTCSGTQAAPLTVSELMAVESHSALASTANSESYTEKLFTHLAGAPIPLNDPLYQRTLGLVQAGQFFQAAQLVTTDPDFLRVRVKHFAVPFIASKFQPVDTLNDFQALIIGLVRDGSDARLLLTGNLRYSGYSSLGLPPVSRANNDHYAQFEARGLDFDRDLERVDKQWDDFPVAAGAFTTRAWAAAYYKMGTNRRSVIFSLDHFLCEPNDSWKIRGLPDYFVRRDVDRSNGGHPELYQNFCRNCHAAMDSFGGAFARLDFDPMTGEILYTPNKVADKYNINTDHYPDGYVTTDDSWVNMLKDHPTINFGWNGEMNGMGIVSFANMLAKAEAFSGCMVKKTFLEVCGQEIGQAAPELLPVLRADFVANGYNLRDLFSKVASQEICISHMQ